MFGLNLIHAGFAAAGLAVALPIVIHLLFRQKSRVVPIGSIRFLLQVVKEHRRRRRVRQWLLLALRMLALLLLAMLFARPYWNRDAALGLQQEIVLLIDRSASMQAKQGGATTFDGARKRLQEELSRINENAIVHVASFDANGVNEVGMDRISEIKATFAATDYGLALDWAGDLLARSERGQKQIVLYTDLQRSGLPKESRTALPPGIELLVKDVGEPMVRNLSIEQVEAVRTELRPDRQLAVRAVIRNHSPAVVRGLQVNCDVKNEKGVQHQNHKEVDIPLQGRAVVEIPLSIQEDGVYSGRVSFQFEDSLAIDNERFFAFSARFPDRVLLVDGEEGRSVYANETYFLETALKLTTEATEGTLRSFEPDRMVWEAGEGFPALGGYRVIVLANIRRLSKVDGARLAEFVKNGGKLLVFVGGNTTAATFEPLVQLGLLPGRLADSPLDGLFRIDQWATEHPVLALFRDPQQGDLRRVTAGRILPLVHLNPNATSFLESKGKVIAATQPFGNGEVVYIGTTADREWTEFPRTRMYVPFVRQLLAWLTDQLGERIPVIERPILRETDRPGIQQIGEQTVVSNITPAELKLDRVTIPQFLEVFRIEAVSDVDREREAEWAKILPANRQREEEIWTSILWILFAVLSVELLLAARIHA